MSAGVFRASYRPYSLCPHDRPRRAAGFVDLQGWEGYRADIVLCLHYHCLLMLTPYRAALGARPILVHPALAVALAGPAAARSVALPKPEAGDYQRNTEDRRAEADPHKGSSHKNGPAAKRAHGRVCGSQNTLRYVSVIT